MNLKGSFVALVTPFYEDGMVNLEKLGELLEFHIANKTDGIVILGTTAESPTLTFEEEEKMVEYCAKKINKRLPLIVGSGSNSTMTAITYSKKYEQLGADALLVITPYYNKTNTSGMIKHFTEIANAVNIPIILYNVPGRTGCNLSIDVLQVISKHPNIIAIKEASGNIGYVAEVATLINDNFQLLSGNDDQILPLLSLGGVGVISVVANILPNQTHDIVHYYLNGNHKKALDLQLKYLKLINSLFIETNPIPIKRAMEYLGYETGPVRLPLDRMSDASFKILESCLIQHMEDLKR